MTKSADKIIQNAVKVFRDKGFNGASVNDIAQAAGLLKGSLYSHFAGKEDILLAVIEDVEQIFFHAAGLDSGTASESDVLMIIDKTAQFFIRNESCLMANLLSESLPEQPKQRLKTFFKTWIARLKDRMQGQIEDRQQEKFAQNAISQLEGSVLMMKVLESPAPVEECAVKLKSEYLQLMKAYENAQFSKHTYDFKDIDENANDDTLVCDICDKDADDLLSFQVQRRQEKHDD